MQLEKVKRLLEIYEQGLIPTLHQHEVNPGLLPDSRENYLYFTLPVCINFQRSSPAMWAAALASWEDETTRYVFFPEKLAQTPREFINEAHSDASELIQLLQVTHRKRFPYLSGPKLSNYWPYILSQYTDVQFKNAHAISIIPDTHVLQSSVRLGLTLAEATPVQVERTWRELLKGSGINPSQVHPVLWNWSRNKFQPEV